MTTSSSVIVAIVAPALQLSLVRPRLTRRSDLVLAGHDAPHSRAHYAYIALAVAGAMLLAT